MTTIRRAVPAGASAMVPWWRLLAAVLVVVALAGPIAAATIVPDPDWIGGYFDGADGDEAASLVWDRAPATAPPALPPLGLEAVAIVAPPIVAPIAFAPSIPAASRAPPA